VRWPELEGWLKAAWRRVNEVLRRLGVILVDDALTALVGVRRWLIRPVADAAPLPPIPAPTGPAPPGIPLAWDVARAIVDVELREIDQLDTKAGVVIGALAVAGGLLLNSTARGVAQVLVGVALVLALVFATLAFLVRKYEYAPDPERFASAAMFDPEYMMEAFLGNVLEAAVVNRERAARKGFYLNVAVGIGALIAIGAVVVKVSGLLPAR